jgi:hypothetical protein
MDQSACDIVGEVLECDDKSARLIRINTGIQLCVPSITNGCRKKMLAIAADEGVALAIWNLFGLNGKFSHRIILCCCYLVVIEKSMIEKSMIDNHFLEALLDLYKKGPPLSEAGPISLTVIGVPACTVICL